MKIACDLHIHSCLSPCGDALMTPNNICNMAKLKGLEAIAVTDHNTAGNLRAVEAVAEEVGIILLPGIEVQTQEETHILCYFPDVEQAVGFSYRLYDSLMDMPNREDLFGEQLIMDSNDEAIAHESRMLLQSSEWDIDTLIREAKAFGGVCVPAHVNRESFSVLYNLGAIPQNAGFKTVEVYPKAPLDVDLSSYRILRSSDAHYIENILEQESFISVVSADRQGVFDYVAAKDR